MELLQHGICELGQFLACWVDLQRKCDVFRLFIFPQYYYDTVCWHSASRKTSTLLIFHGIYLGPWWPLNGRTPGHCEGIIRALSDIKEGMPSGNHCWETIILVSYLCGTLSFHVYCNSFVNWVQYQLSCSWWHHQMETFSTLLALCVGNSPVTSEFPSQRPVMRSFDVFFDLHLNKRLSKQLWGRWFETPLHSLWSHCNVQ